MTNEYKLIYYLYQIFKQIGHYLSPGKQLIIDWYDVLWVGPNFVESRKDTECFSFALYGQMHQM